MRYRTRTGVVMTSICGETVLISAEAIRDQVPYLTQLNESSAFLWRLLETGADEAELERAVLEEYEIEDPAAARDAIRAFLHQMLQGGYLVPEGGNNREE